MKAPNSMAPFAYMGGISDRACVPLLQNVVDGLWDFKKLGEHTLKWKSRQAVMNAVISWLESQGRLDGTDVWADEDEKDNSGAPRRVLWDKVREVYTLLDDTWLNDWVNYYNKVCATQGRRTKHEMSSDFYKQLDARTDPILLGPQVCYDLPQTR